MCALYPNYLHYLHYLYTMPLIYQIPTNFLLPIYPLLSTLLTQYKNTMYPLSIFYLQYLLTIYPLSTQARRSCVLVTGHVTRVTATVAARCSPASSAAAGPWWASPASGWTAPGEWTELQTKIRKDFTITEEAPSRAFFFKNPCCMLTKPPVPYDLCVSVPISCLLTVN